MSSRSRFPRRHGAPALLVAAACLALTLLLVPPGAGAVDEAPPGAAHDELPPSPPFDDVPLDHPFFADIGWLATEGIAEGRDDGTFGPEAPVTRGAMAAFLVRYRGATPPACTLDPFPDVAAGHHFCAEIAWLAAEEIAGGFPDGRFRPGAVVSRQAMAAFLYRLAGPTEGAGAAGCTGTPFTDVPPEHPFCKEISWLVEAGVVEGLAATTFGPTRPVSRQTMAALLHRLDAYEALPVPSPGCGMSEVEPELEERIDLDVAGTERWYLRTVPAAHDGETPLPLVVDFHGLAEGAQIHTLMSAFSPLAQSEGFVVVFPHGTGNPVRWNVALDPTGNPDLVFVDALLDDLGDDLCLDLSRVYAAGLSNGAFMTSAVACVRADRFAAAVPVAGILRPSTCAPTRPVPMLTYHGTADTILLFNGGIGTLPGSTTTPPSVTTTTAPPDLNGPGYPANVRAWAAGNGCDPVATDTQETDDLLRRVYDCPRGADVEFTIVIDGGHAWPGSAFSQAIAAVIGYTTMDADATAEAWAFFERHHR